MSNQCSITFDASKVEKILEGLTDDKRNEILMAGLKAGGKELVTLTKQNLVRKVKGATKTGGKSWSKAMTDGIRQINEKDYTEVIVSIMRDARLIWEELGTDDRYLLTSGAKDRERGYTGDKRILYRKAGTEKKYHAGAYRGKIEPTNFFGEARQSPTIAKNVEEQLVKALEKALRQPQ